MSDAAALFGVAYSYWRAMCRLLTEGKLHYAESAPFFLLAGFCLELSFKAIILTQGGTERENKSIGHNLEKAYNAALRGGYSPFDPDKLYSLVKVLHGSHLDMFWRYMGGGDRSVLVPDETETLEILIQNLNHIQEQFGLVPTEV